MKLAIAALLALVRVASADKPPAGAKAVKIDYTYSSFQSNELHYKLEWNQTAYRADNKTTVDGKYIAALYTSLVNLNEFESKLSCTSHTDDYPHITITIEGDSPLVIESDSNCHDHIPWNVTRNGKHYAQLTDEIARAAMQLLATVDPKHWKARSPDTPLATMSLGYELVMLGGSSSYPPAQACAKDLAASPRVKQAIGAIANVDTLVSCDLGAPDCKTLVVQASFETAGVHVDMVEMRCTKGTIDLDAPTLKLLGELKWFIDSKPMRALVKWDPPVRMWPNVGWMANGNTSDGPDLSFEPGKKSIHIRAWSKAGPNPRGVAYLKLLSLDGAKLTKTENTWYETEVDVDANGKVMP